MYDFVRSFVSTASGISTMTRELTRGRSTHLERSRMMARVHPRSLPYYSMFRLFKSLVIFIHAHATVGYTPVCKCELRLPGGAIPPPDRSTRPAEPRCVLLTLLRDTQSEIVDRTWCDARPRLYIAIVKTRLVNFIRKEGTRIPVSPGT